ncbi:MAG: S41 family peptidase [Bacteroidales bacterium]|nr:S41 family peptidase [Bacteroidales bacterium]
MHIKNNTCRLVLIATSLLLASCEKMFMSADMEPTPTATFDYMWTQIDERYSLFDVKDVDWNQMRDSLRPQVFDGMSNDSLFAVLKKLINSLNDGHVDIWGNNDVASSEEIFLQRYGNGNFDLNTVVLNYLRANHHTTGGMSYNTVSNGDVLYIRYSSFSNSASEAQIDAILQRYPDVKGFIFDIRQNGGGAIQNEWNLMAFLPNEGQLLYTTQLKAGPAHNDFGIPQQVFAPSNGNHTPISKPFVLLTDRGCYSAASSFALCLKSYSNVIVMGDTTGGGLAIPAGGALPNGWHYRFGVSRTIAPDGVNYENGVPPDQLLRLDPAAVANGHDNIIDSAARLIVTSDLN